MPEPSFTKSTIETLGKRARYLCSNPDCAAVTVGPNTDPTKSTTIGEAAHIMGAKPGAQRYDRAMSDAARSSITNSIWLCRNCHGLIDRDGTKFPAELLFAWRRSHEERVAKEFGTRGDLIRYQTETAAIHFLSAHPAIIQRIVLDKPPGWEWRFVAELMRDLNKPHLKRLKNLQSGHYYRPQNRIQSEEFLSWVVERTYAMPRLIHPFSGLLDRLTASWGAPGEPADLEEMYDVCVLLRDALATIVDFEESLFFANIPEEGEPIRKVLTNAIGPCAANLIKIPEKLDEMVEMIATDHGGTAEKPLIIQWSFPFELPTDLNERFEEALKRYESSLQ